MRDTQGEALKARMARWIGEVKQQPGEDVTSYAERFRVAILRIPEDARAAMRPSDVRCFMEDGLINTMHWALKARQLQGGPMAKSLRTLVIEADPERKQTRLQLVELGQELQDKLSAAAKLVGIEQGMWWDTDAKVKEVEDETNEDGEGGPSARVRALRRGQH